MTPPPAGTPWWAWALVAIVPAIASALASWAASRRTRQDVAVIRHQVTNTHESNFRDDVDELATKVDRLSEGLAAVRSDVGGVHSEVRDARLDIEGVRTDARRERRRLNALTRTVHVALERAQTVIDTNHPGTQLRDPTDT